eukprot:scaffold265341_cov35-Tisochrysis_lutea.AAC.3
MTFNWSPCQPIVIIGVPKRCRYNFSVGARADRAPLSLPAPRSHDAPTGARVISHSASMCASDERCQTHA